MIPMLITALAAMLARALRPQWAEGDEVIVAVPLPGKLPKPVSVSNASVEPMTAPANALVSGWGLQLIEPGGSLRATCRVIVHQGA